MPKPRFNFARLPSAPPPGSSHFISNALIIAKRVALGLEDPVRIPAGKWQRDHPIIDWYHRHQDAKILCMQLRKERKAPFFHEYVTFRLDDRRCFRLDRRQLPDEQSPMDCAEAKGVEAYDTIEEIASLEDSTYNPSDCLVEMNFRGGVSPALFLILLPAISAHGKASVYTVQRYNCYFYAQTAILCTLCLKYGWDEGYLWQADDRYPDNAETPKTPTPLAGLEKNAGITIKILDKRSNKLGSSPLGAVQESTIGKLQAYIWDMIHAHSARVEQYRFLLRSNAEDVDRDIKTAMNEVWHQVMSSHHIFHPHFITQQVTLHPDTLGRIQFDEGMKPNRQLSAWYRSQQNPWVTSMQLRKERSPTFLHEYVAFKLRNGSYFRIDRRQSADEQSPVACVEDKSTEAYDTMEPITHLEDSKYNPSDCLVQLDFKQGVSLEMLFTILREISRHRQANRYTSKRYNSHFYARTVLLCALCFMYGWDQDHLWGADNRCLDKTEPPNSQAALFEMTKQPGIDIRISDKQPDKPRDSRSGMMRESTIGDLQAYIGSLIHAHSVRVEQYKFVFGWSAEDIERDIKTAMNEVWHQVMSACYISNSHPTHQDTPDPDKRIHIQFGRNRRPSDQLSDWYERHRTTRIMTMLLYKERSPPFFREYILFRLHDGSHYRVDRRHSPDEQSPMACVEDKATEAYDSIKPITHPEDSKYNPSDCLVHLDFGEGIPPSLLFIILLEISTHKEANRYTYKRYNSNFYAQTVLLCTLCFTYGWDQGHLWGVDNRSLDNVETPNRQIALFEIKQHGGASIKILDERLDKSKESQQGAMQESTIGDLQAYLQGMIHAHSLQVEQVNYPFGWSAEDIEQDIQTVMNEVWHQVMRVRIQFDGNQEPSYRLSDWYARHRTNTIITMQLRKEQDPPFFHQYVVFKLSSGLCFRVDRRQISAQQGGEAYDAIEPISDLEHSMYYTSHCLIQLDFEVRASLKILIDIFRAIASHRWESAYIHGQFNCCFYAQTVIHCACALRVYRRWGEGQLWRTNDPSENDLHRTVEVPGYLIKISIMHERPAPKVHSQLDGHGSDDIAGSSARNELKGTRPGASHVPTMEKSTYIEVKRYLSDLIREHGTPVEKYEFLLNSTGRNVEQDIKTAMNEIWSQLAPKKRYSPWNG